MRCARFHTKVRRIIMKKSAEFELHSENRLAARKYLAILEPTSTLTRVHGRAVRTMRNMEGSAEE